MADGQSRLPSPHCFCCLQVQETHQQLFLSQYPDNCNTSLCVGGCGSGVEAVSCYQKVAGLIPLVCMLKCPWARY